MEHDIIFDLLPLYHDGVCSAASRAAESTVPAQSAEHSANKVSLISITASLPLP